MTLQLTPTLEQRLEHMAAESGRTPNDLAQEVIAEYLAHIDAITADVREAEEEADREGWLTSEQVWERIQTRFPKSA